MKIIGVLLVILGILSIVFGGIILSIYNIYDLVINWEELTRVEVFWDIFWITLRDIFVMIGGLLLLLFGTALINVKNYEKK